MESVYQSFIHWVYLKSRIKGIYCVFCGMLLYMMVAPTTIKDLLLYGVAGIILAYGIINSSRLAPDEKTVSRVPAAGFALIITVFICAFVFRSFICNWAVSGTINRLAFICHIPTAALLFIICSIILLAVIPGLVALICECVYTAYYNVKTIPVRTAVFILFVLAASFQLQYSCVPSFHSFFQVNTLFIFTNTLAIGLYSRLACLLFKNKGVALTVAALTTFSWSLINYYVIMFHGSPLFFSEFQNALTAFNVASKYHYSLDHNIIILVFLSLIQFICSLIVGRLGIKEENKVSKNIFGAFSVCLGFSLSVVLVFTNSELKPKSTMTGSWTYGVNDYGYVCCIFEDIDRRINPIVEPEGYAPEYLVKQNPDAHFSNTKGIYPDIVIILNESFYDLRVFTDIETDYDFLCDFYGIENAHFGYVIQPGYCGGTNNTEFELLTSNSMALLPISAPFTYLDFSSNKNSVAEYLKNKGYSTAAMHCGAKSNYSRNRVYPLLGFDDCFLGSETFTYSQYGNRPWMDADNYHDLIAYYEQMGDNPRFVYLLTFQNHGGWEQNESSYDTVHSLTDFGEMTGIVNEYLSSVKQSGMAFAELITYFKTNDRPMIVFMMGDHAPSFMPNLSANNSLTESEARLASHSVPYAVWANFEIEWSKDTAYMTTIDVVPQIKKWCEMPMTPYDCAILKMHEAAPCRLPSGEYWTPSHQAGYYQPYSEEYPSTVIRRYLFMEYNLLKGGRDYCKDFFQ